MVMLQHEARVIRSCCEGVKIIKLFAICAIHVYQSVLIEWEKLSAFSYSSDSLSFNVTLAFDRSSKCLMLRRCENNEGVSDER